MGRNLCSSSTINRQLLLTVVDIIIINLEWLGKKEEEGEE
jgi:hypothetical protein